MRRIFLFLSAFFLLLAGFLRDAEAAGWGFGAEIGSITAVEGGTPFVFRLTPSKRSSEEFSLGMSFYLTPAGDNKMYSGAFIARFHAKAGRLLLTPFLGAGVVHRRTDTDNDTAIMFPVGATLGYPVGEALFLVGTVSVNLHDLELDGKEDTTSIGLTAGIAYSP